MLSFGQRLKLLRKEADLSQNDLAEQLFVSVQSVSKWECDNAMPDIGQIVPLAAILGVTTDCLLGVGTDEKADREKLENETFEIIVNGEDRSYASSCHMKACALYRDYLKKYPLDYKVKLDLAYSIVNALRFSNYYSWEEMKKEEENALYNESVKLITSVLHHDHDVRRLIEAKIILIDLYIFYNEFDKAESIALELPDIYDLRKGSLYSIFEAQKDREKCLALAEEICESEGIAYTHSLMNKARSISVLGNDRKLDAIKAWEHMEVIAKEYHKVYNNTDSLALILTSLSRRSNDYIAISQFDRFFEVMYEFVDWCVERLRLSIEIVEPEHRDEINFGTPEDQLRPCYNWCFPTDDNIITNDPRYKECCQKLAAAIAELNS